MGRAPCCEKVGIKRGRWTAEEDHILRNYIRANGEGSWRSLPKNAGLLRCGKSCRLRWINYLRSDLKRGNISTGEEEAIINLHSSLGNKDPKLDGSFNKDQLERMACAAMLCPTRVAPKLDIWDPKLDESFDTWSLIAGHLPGRTDNEIKNYWNTHLNRKIQTSTTATNTNTNEITQQPEVTTTENRKRRKGRTSRFAMKKNKTYLASLEQRKKQDKQNDDVMVSFMPTLENTAMGNNNNNNDDIVPSAAVEEAPITAPFLCCDEELNDQMPEDIMADKENREWYRYRSATCFSSTDSLIELDHHGEQENWNWNWNNGVVQEGDDKILSWLLEDEEEEEEEDEEISECEKQDAMLAWLQHI